MTGMKEGAGEDPFADSSNDQHEETSTRTADEEPAIESSSEIETTTNSQNESIDIPYKFRRDSVQDGRSRVPLFLQPETKTAERDAMRELEDRFDDDVSMTDLREALVRVGLANLDETESELEDWGYGLKFD